MAFVNWAMLSFSICFDINNVFHQMLHLSLLGIFLYLYHIHDSLWCLVVHHNQ
jgi:hypothetical protein